MSRTPQPGLKPLTSAVLDRDRLPAQESFGLRAYHITGALDYAKSFSYQGGENDYRREVQKWAYENLPALLRGTEIQYGEDELRRLGPEKATQALFGSLLGGAVIRSVTDEGITDLESCRINLDTWRIPERGFVYDGVEREHDEMLDVFGPEVAKGFAQISNPAAASMCAMVVGMTLVPLTGRDAGFTL